MRREIQQSYRNTNLHIYIARNMTFTTAYKKCQKMYFLDQFSLLLISNYVLHVVATGKKVILGRQFHRIDN